MLRTNLSTRPFYNERAVRTLLLTLGGLLLLLCLFDLQQVIVLSGRLKQATAQARFDQERAGELRVRADRLRAGIRTPELLRVQDAAREANDIIDRRTFSWTQLFNLIETTLPNGVMLSAIRPQIDRGVITVTMLVIGRSVADIDEFMDGLEKTGAFFDMLSTDEQTLEEGELRVTLVGRYRPPEEATGAADVRRTSNPAERR
jgi:type IV pilus assembly protein PilN